MTTENLDPAVTVKVHGTVGCIAEKWEESDEVTVETPNYNGVPAPAVNAEMRGTAHLTAFVGGSAMNTTPGDKQGGEVTIIKKPHIATTPLENIAGSSN